MNNEIKLEDALVELEQITAQLEDARTSLEETIELYTRGTALVAQCRQLLARAEFKLETINREISE